MFNNLNNAANQGRPAVDDIFAETDKTSEGGLPGVNSVAGVGNSSAAAAAPRAEIETRHVGLTAGDEMTEETTEKAGGNKWFKIILILIVAAILILGGYLVYSKFFKANPAANSNTPAPVVRSTPAENQTPTPTPTEVGSFVATTSGNESATNSGESPVIVTPEIPGVNAPATNATATTVLTTTTPASLIDSDSDGLTDAEETGLGTNINVIDTDNDGLSDYEEVKIYHTNPLSADTDADGYLDGAEVNGGYDPNGPGKLVKP